MPETGDGDLAIEMAEDFNYKTDEWQQLLIKQVFSEDLFQLGFTAPRQNGKSAVLEVLMLYAGVILGHKIIFTAHQQSSALIIFQRMKSRWFENPEFPDLMQGSTCRNRHGEESVTFDNGGSIVFKTRSSTAGRGYTCDWLILDESQEMKEQDFESLQPTLIASPDAKIIMTGTAPLSTREGQGVIFQRYRKQAYDGELHHGQVYAEWGIDDFTKVDLSDEDLWRRINPAWDYRINKRVLRSAFITMDNEAFARENLGYWFKSGQTFCYKPDDWTQGICERPDKFDIEQFAMGVSYSADGEMWACAFGAKLKDGDYYSELIDIASTKKGTLQLLQIAKHFTEEDNFCGILSENRGQTQNLIGDAQDTELIKHEIIEMCRATDKLASYALFDNLIGINGFKHSSQVSLEESFLSLDKYSANRDSGGFKFMSRKGKLVASEAVALSLHWCKSKKPLKTKKKQQMFY